MGERVRVGGECLKLFGDDRPVFVDLVGDLYSYVIFSNAVILCLLFFGDDFIVL